jgi:hypothetical protein
MMNSGKKQSHVTWSDACGFDAGASTNSNLRRQLRETVMKKWKVKIARKQLDSESVERISPNECILIVGHCFYTKQKETRHM